MSEWLAVYDVSDDRTRRLLARTLEPFGRRVCYSVFELRLPEHRTTRLLDGARDLLAPADRYLQLRLCPRCRRAAVGAPLEPPCHATVVV